MRIGYFIGAATSDTDAVLATVASDLIERGFDLCGVIQTNDRRRGETRCDMVVHVLPDGPDIGISQNLGSGARGCRLDTDALERAVARIRDRLSLSTGALILNKFGTHEALGKGFRPIIADAVSLEVPVLLKVSPLNLDAFSRFAAGYADLLAPDTRRLADWVISMADQKASRTIAPQTT